MPWNLLHRYLPGSWLLLPSCCRCCSQHRHLLVLLHRHWQRHLLLLLLLVLRRHSQRHLLLLPLLLHGGHLLLGHSCCRRLLHGRCPRLLLHGGCSLLLLLNSGRRQGLLPCQGCQLPLLLLLCHGCRLPLLPLLLLLSRRLLLPRRCNLLGLLRLLQLPRHDLQQNLLTRPSLPGCKPVLALPQRHIRQVLPMLVHQGCDLLLHRQVNLPLVQMWPLHRC